MVEITWLGHGTFQFRLESGEVVVVDPWIEGNPSFPKGFEIDRVDVMLITHGHFDHIGDAIPLAAKFKPLVISNYEICTWLASKGVENCSGMNKGGTQSAGPLKVTMTHAVHSCGISDGDQIIYGGDACGYVLHVADGRRMYFAGDTAVFGDMGLIGELYKPDLAFLPIGDLFTMGPQEAALATLLVAAPQVIPMHFGTFPPLTGRPEHLSLLIRDNSQTEVLPLEIGQPYQW